MLKGEEARIELRSPDAAANPYLVFAVCLAAGLDGIEKKTVPAKSSAVLKTVEKRRRIFRKI